MTLPRFLSFIFLLLFATFGSAQQIHFVYLQTENGQPFYVKLNNQVTSSSSAGYLILPKLPDGDYMLAVGFPKKEYPEEIFTISVDKDNEGFLLKNFNEKGWGLFNLQSYAVVMGTGTERLVATSKELKDDPFSRMLANVVKDSSILEKNTVTRSPPSDAVVKNPVAVKDTSVATEVIAPPAITSNVTRTLFNENADGLEMVYIDKAENYVDTIRLLMPLSDLTLKKDEDASFAKNDESAGVPAVDSAPGAAIRTETGHNIDRPVFISDNIVDTSNNIGEKRVAEDVSLEKQDKNIKGTVALDVKTGVEDSAEIINQPANVIENNERIKSETKVAGEEHPKVIKSTYVNSDCTAFASNDDFIKLRKKMAGEKNNEDMIKAADKVFRSLCFSTEQIKNLSFLLLSDEGKYKFFDAAYPFTSDSNLYYTLQTQLRDPYYVNRFKAMMKK